MERERKLKDIVKRPLNSKKYDYGHLLIIGGSKHYAGAPLLNALGAAVAGVDLVTIAAPKRVADIAVAYSPDLVSYPLSGDVLDTDHFTEINSIMKRNVTAVLVGSGMGREKKSFDLLAQLHKEHKSIPFIFDADALYCTNLVDLCAKDLLIPNLKEFSLISGNEALSSSAIKTTAFSVGCTILAKGPIDYISDGKRVKEVEDTSGKSVYLAKGGTGDILAGVCASLIAQGVEPFDAAYAGASAVKKAGASLSRECGPFFMPTGLLGVLPRALVAELGK